MKQVNFRHYSLLYLVSFKVKQRSACEVAFDLATQIQSLYLKYFRDEDPADSSVLEMIKKDPAYSMFCLSTGELQQVDFSRMSPDERKAFWLNIFNTLLHHTYLEMKFPTSNPQKTSLVTSSSSLNLSMTIFPFSSQSLVIKLENMESFA